MPSHTRAYIEARIQRILDREDLNNEISDWFQVAHRQAQRRHDFLAMQLSAFTGITAGQYQFEVPSDFKNAILLYVYDPFTASKTRTFIPASIEEVRNERVNPLTEDKSLYALWSNIFEIDPAISDSEAAANYQMRLDYHCYLPDPSMDGEDYFTINAEDYLVYGSLCESAPFLGADTRLKMWEAKSLQTWTELYRTDIAARQVGTFQIRG